jgi:hypothetical protein
MFSWPRNAWTTRVSTLFSNPQGSWVRLFDFRTRGFACGGVGRRRCCQGSKRELGGPGGTASFGDERRLVLDNAHQTARSLCRGCLSKSAANHGATSSRPGPAPRAISGDCGSQIGTKAVKAVPGHAKSFAELASTKLGVPASAEKRWVAWSAQCELAAAGGPRVRIRLPPAKSLLRTCGYVEPCRRDGLFAVAVDNCQSWLKLLNALLRTICRSRQARRRCRRR